MGRNGIAIFDDGSYTNQEQATAGSDRKRGWYNRLVRR